MTTPSPVLVEVNERGSEREREMGSKTSSPAAASSMEPPHPEGMPTPKARVRFFHPTVLDDSWCSMGEALHQAVDGAEARTPGFSDRECVAVQWVLEKKETEPTKVCS